MMSWLDFFRKPKKEEASVARELSIKDIKHLIAEEQERIKEQKEKIKESIEKNLSVLISELKVSLGILRTLNIDKIKEQEKLKIIVKENLYFYVSYLEKLINSIEKLPSSLSAEDFLAQIQSIFNNFKKSSDKSFEKATILIGQKLGSVKKSIKEFFYKNNSIISENKDLFNKNSIIAKLQETLAELEKTKEIISKVNINIFELEKQTEKLENEKSKQESSYTLFIGSPEYKKALEEKQNIKKELELIDSELRNIKNKIDFKLLLKHFYSDIKKRELLSSYRENFLEALEFDKELELANLVSEVYGLDFDLKAKISEAKTRKSLLEEKNKETHAEIKEKAIKEAIKEKEFAITQYNNEIIDENKKISRFNEKLLSLMAEIENKAKDAFGNLRVVE